MYKNQLSITFVHCTTTNDLRDKLSCIMKSRHLSLAPVFELANNLWMITGCVMFEATSSVYSISRFTHLT